MHYRYRIAQIHPHPPQASGKSERNNHHYETVHTTADETAAILFTSGSTGVPKGAVYSHGNFIAQVEALRAIYQITPGEIDYHCDCPF